MAINLDLNKTPRVVGLGALLWVLPGGLLVVGLILFSSDYVSRHVDVRLGTIETIAIVIFVSYVAGFAIVLLTEFFCNLLLTPVTRNIYRRLKQKQEKNPPWRDPAFRAMLRCFIPDRLVLPPEPLWDPDAISEWARTLSTNSDSLGEAVSTAPDVLLRSVEAEAAWRCWYETAQAYISFSTNSTLRRIDTRAYFMSTLQSLGSAAMILLILSSISNGWIWLAAIFLVLVGTLGMLSEKITTINVQNGPELAAMLLHEIKQNSQSA